MASNHALVTCNLPTELVLKYTAVTFSERNVHITIFVRT